MNVDRTYQPVTTLGPGTRIAVWTAGCSKRCPGCANPELWEADPARAVPAGRVARLLAGLAGQTGIHRLTVTGGDPLEQPDDLLAVLEAVRPSFDDVLVYTGYTVEQAHEALGADRFARLAAVCDVLVDGPYVESLNDGICALRGSTNQRVLVNHAARLLKPGLARSYDEALGQPRRIQNAVFAGRSLSIGIHGRPDSAMSAEGPATAAPGPPGMPAATDVPHRRGAPIPSDPATDR